MSFYQIRKLAYLLDSYFTSDCPCWIVVIISVIIIIIIIIIIILIIICVSFGINYNLSWTIVNLFYFVIIVREQAHLPHFIIKYL